jgi:hypothetical protein
MKRIVVLIDGTWDKEGITRKAPDGTVQQVYHHAGVGNGGGVDPENPRRSDTHGLKQIIREAYEARCMAL